MSTAAPIIETPTYTLDGLVFNATDPATGVDWIVTEESGWSDSAPVRISVAEREDHHGGLSGPVWRGSRLINLKGVALAPTRLSMLAAKDRLRDCADDGAYELSVAEDHLTRTALVKHAAEIRIRDVGSRAFEWELALRADDPLRYGPVLIRKMSLPTTIGSGLTWPLTWPITFGAGSVGGSDVVFNEGNAPTYPQLAITGPLTAPTIHNTTTDRVMTLGLTLAAGDQLLVDHANQLISVSGITRFDALTPESTWWPVVPGQNGITFTAATSTTEPELSVTYRSAWK